MSQDSINYERLSENFWQGLFAHRVWREATQAGRTSRCSTRLGINQTVQGCRKKGWTCQGQDFIREKLLKLIANHTKNRIAAATNRFNSNHIQISVINERFLGGGKKFGELFSDMLTM